MNVFSGFDGMSCGRLALGRSGVDVSNYIASEIDPFAIKVASKNYPDNINIGDITKVKANDLPEIDIMLGGSPCQGLSIGNRNRQLLNDHRSKLFYDFIRLLDAKSPKYFILENVMMDEISEAEFSRLTGVQPIMINSSLVSGQRRERLYWTNIPNITQPKDKGILFKDILDENPKGFDLSATLLSRYRKTHEDDGSRLVIGTTAIEGKIGQRDRVYGVNNKIPTLTATDYKQPKQVLVDGMLRKITPLECERLQTVPDNYTDCVSNTQRYKMLGNGWTVDVISHILDAI
tara:strand:+ start:122 stop:991 length:870 start_codon:yes stop_codon:yes gene_type:complete